MPLTQQAFHNSDPFAQFIIQACTPKMASFVHTRPLRPMKLMRSRSGISASISTGY